MRIAIVTFGLTLIAVACGPTEDEDGDGDGDGAEDTSNPGDGDGDGPDTGTGSDGTTGGSTGSDPGSDGTTGPSNDTDGPPGPVADDLFPMPEGASWTYEVTGDGAICPTGSQTATVGTTVDAGGRQATEYITFCGGRVHPVIAAPSGVEIYIESADSWSVMLDTPIEDGHSWTFAAYDNEYTYEDAGTITVPAGTFDNCWTRLDSLGPTSTYCPGIGKVREERPAAYVAELTGYTVP